MNHHKRLSRKEAAKFLAENGYMISIQTLSKFACVGGGPDYEKWGKFALYKPEELLVWAESRLEPVPSKSHRQSQVEC